MTFFDPNLDNSAGLSDDILDRLQSMAVQLRTAMDCASAFLNEPLRLDLVAHLVEEASAIAGAIGRVVDSCNRPVQKPSRILELFHQFCETRDRANRHVPTATGKAEDEEMELLFWMRCDLLETQIKAEPCTTAAEFAAKMIIETDHGSLIPDWEEHPIWQEARALVGMQEDHPKSA